MLREKMCLQRQFECAFFSIDLDTISTLLRVDLLDIYTVPGLTKMESGGVCHLEFHQ